MSEGKRFLAVDWGTTNRRVFLIENGVVIRTERDDHGVKSVQDFAGEAAAIRDRFGAYPMLLAGMVGSTIGWQLTPYIPAPAGIEELGAGLLWVEEDIAIIPGVSANDPADVMRGEEVQLLGAVAAGMAPADAILCQPGTHCKWARMAGGKIAGFSTAMTGEMYALLHRHALIGSELVDMPEEDAGFALGVAESAKGDLLGSLFSVRSRCLLGQWDDMRPASYVSGLLIGSDCRAHVTEGVEDVYLLADPGLGALYSRAISMIGGRAYRIDSYAAFLAGILKINEVRSCS